jgi:hypothetical protein
VEEIIEFIIKYQNHLTSSFLFIELMPELIEVGVKVKSLLCSNVFCVDFDFDEWPSTHPCSEDAIRPYNKTMFQIRKHYRQVFPESKFAPLDDDGEEGN